MNTCEWFALCDHPATGTMHHPILGDVPICDRCRAKTGRVAVRDRRAQTKREEPMSEKSLQVIIAEVYADDSELIGLIRDLMRIVRHRTTHRAAVPYLRDAHIALAKADAEVIASEE